MHRERSSVTPPTKARQVHRDHRLFNVSHERVRSSFFTGRPGHYHVHTFFHSRVYFERYPYPFFELVYALGRRRISLVYFPIGAPGGVGSISV